MTRKARGIDIDADAREMNEQANSLSALGRLEEALKLRDDVVARFGAAREPLLRDAVARASLNGALALRRLGRDADAVARLKGVLERFEDEPPLALPYIAVYARFERLRGLAKLGRLDDAIAETDVLVARYGDVEALAVRVKVAEAMWLKCQLLGRYDRDDAAKVEPVLTSLDELLSRVGDAREPELRMVASMALHLKASVSLEYGRIDDGVALGSALVERFEIETDPEQRIDLAARLVNIGDGLVRARLFEQALVVFGAVLAGAEKMTDRANAEAVVRSLYTSALALVQLDRADDAIGCLDEVLAHFGDSPGPDIDAWLVRALSVKAQLLLRAGQTVEAVVLNDALVSRFESDVPLTLVPDIGGMVVETGNALFKAEQFEDAIRAFQAVVARCGGANDPALRRLIVHALSSMSASFAHLDQTEEAIRAHQRMVLFGEDAIVAFEQSAARCEESADPERRVELVHALVGKAQVLIELGRQDEALSILSEILTRSGEDVLPDVQAAVASARQIREAMLE